MTEICSAAIHLCRIRVTRLDNLGNPVAGPHNVYVSDKPIMLTVKPVIEAGASKTLTGGCDCIIADYRGFDKLKRFDLELDQGVLEPALLEMMLGTSAIVDGVTGGVIGNWWKSQLTCSEPAQPNVCFEAWQDNWEDDHPHPDFPYVHWIWPSARWQIADMSLQNDFNQPKLTGYSRGNPQWGTGIFDDLPEAAESLGGWFYATDIPDAVCGYQSWAIT
jgi:hypothetical protein